MGQSPQMSNLFISIILALYLFSRAHNPHWFQSKYNVSFFCTSKTLSVATWNFFRENCVNMTYLNHIYCSFEFGLHISITIRDHSIIHTPETLTQAIDKKRRVKRNYISGLKEISGKSLQRRVIYWSCFILKLKLIYKDHFL